MRRPLLFAPFFVGYVVSHLVCKKVGYVASLRIVDNFLDIVKNITFGNGLTSPCPTLIVISVAGDTANKSGDTTTMFKLFIVNTSNDDEQGIAGSFGTASEARKDALVMLGTLDAVSRVSGIQFRIEIRRTSDNTAHWSMESVVN